MENLNVSHINKSPTSPSPITASSPVPIASPYEDELSHTRLIVLLESAPGSNIFRQVLFTKEQFLAVSDAIKAQMKIVSPTSFDVPIRFNPKIKIEDLEDNYTDDEIRRLF